MSSTITLERSLSYVTKRESDQNLVVPLIDKEKKKTTADRLKRDCKCVLVDYNSLPEFLKHNEFVVNYYRSEWPLKQTILSIFSIHNETLNIWTHLIGFFIFLALATTTIYSIYDTRIQHATTNLNPWSTTLNKNSAITRWPFYAYLVGAMFCLLTSSICHLLSCHSQHTCYITLRADYIGITALIVTSFYPLLYYTFIDHPFIRNLYMGFITIFGVASILVSLMTMFERPKLRFVRAGLFACMGLSGLVPIVHKLVAFGDQPEAVITAIYEMKMLSFYGIGVIVYALRIPERWMPGKFDLFGHSHQLWHVLVIAGAYTHYLAGLVYMSWRDNEGVLLR